MDISKVGGCNTPTTPLVTSLLKLGGGSVASLPSFTDAHVVGFRQRYIYLQIVGPFFTIFLLIMPVRPFSTHSYLHAYPFHFSITPKKGHKLAYHAIIPGCPGGGAL